VTELVDRLEAQILEASPALARLLSPLGRRAAFPPDIPFQAAQAQGTTFNGTIGQITDGAGRPVPLPSLARGLEGLEVSLRDRALLYSPVPGFPELRASWRRRQRRGVSDDRPSTTPLVTVGLTHGLALVADLFGGEDRPIAVPSPFWGNYRQTFELRTGARIVSAPAYVDGRYNCDAMAQALADEPPGRPAVAILNLPSNPGGYSLTRDERGRVIDSLVAVADQRPLLVVCDDAYAGLVYEEAIPSAPVFWDLVGRHPNLVPVKIDGATKEVSFFGGRVGFVTFPFEPGSEVEAALESKLKCLVRAGVGSPVAASQALLLAALENEDLDSEVEAIRLELGRRYRALRDALAGIDRELVSPLPFNSGCFALLELAARAGVTSEALRRHLLDHHDTGVVAIAPRFVRVALCSVAERSLPELVERLMTGVSELAAR